MKNYGSSKESSVPKEAKENITEDAGLQRGKDIPDRRKCVSDSMVVKTNAVV